MKNAVNSDAHDGALLKVLQRNGRITINDLVDKAGLSPLPVTRRLRLLEDEGTGYAALIDEMALGYEFSVFVSIKLDRQVDDSLARFEAAVRVYPKVLTVPNAAFMPQILEVPERQREPHIHHHG